MEPLEQKVFKAFNQLLSPSTNTLVVGVSGGADSMALALLAKDYAHQKSYGLQAVTINHQLRNESAAEALWVGQTLNNFKISHQTLIWHHEEGLNRRHERARKARYQLLLEFCKKYPNSVLLTAHHQQDQAETVLMRFLKGSGPAGFQGIQALRSQNGVPIARPLLKTSPEELRSYLKDNNLSWVEDPSNNNTNYERTRVRLLLAHLSEWGQNGILASASKIYEMQQTVEAHIAENAKNFVISKTPLIIDQAKFFTCSEPVQRDWLRQQIWQIGNADYPKPYKTITAILQILKQPTVNGYKVAGCLINVIKGTILFHYSKGMI